MRLDDVSPRTLLLGALAGWAVIAWALALAGMGGRLPGPESGAIAAPGLPPAPRTVAPAIGPFGSYAGIAARPLFAVDRRPHPFVLQNDSGAPTEAPDFDLVLTSVLIAPQANIAIVQKPDGSGAWRVRTGEAPESFPAWRLVSLQPRSATFAGPEGEKTLELRVFNGQGGAAPTAVGGPGPTTEMPGPVPVPPVPATGPGSPAASVPPATDANAPDPEQIEAIRRRIEARREQMRQRAQSPTPPATVAPPPPPPTR